jgi:hypothetical protein
VLILIGAGCGLRSQAAGTTSPAATPSQWAEFVLNDQVNWPPSPGQQVTMRDDLGFAADRLFHVPAAGIHPRILFGPDDLPRIRQQLSDTAMGRAIMTTIRGNLARGIDKPGTYENKCFIALVRGDIATFEKTLSTDISSQPAGAGPSADFAEKAAVRWGQRDPFLTSMEMRCWVALLDNDIAKGHENAAAIATYATHLRPGIEQAIAGPFGFDWWKGIRPALGSDSELAFGYDWTQPFMTPQQAEGVRKVISLATAGRFTEGMDLPHHWRTWNHIGMALHEPVLALAIEGEAGYDPRIYQRGIEVARDYLTYGITEKGFGKEGIGYQTAGMSHTGVLMLAAANRGENLLLHPHFQAYFSNYLYWAMEPFGNNWVSEGDLAVFPPNIAVTSLAKFFYPNSPQVETVFRNLPNIVNHTEGAGFAGNVWETMLTCPVDQSPTGSTLPSAPPPHSQGDGLTELDANRGMLITRTGWNPDDLVLHFDCRTDATYATHEHADHGQFTFAADGCAWAITGIRDTETQYHNCVTIDGHGQGYFPPPGKWIGINQTAGGVMATVDTKYCWDWFWPKPIFLEPVDQLKREGELQYQEPAQRLLSRYPLSAFERETIPSVMAFYNGYMIGDPRMWAEDFWVYRGPNYPVQRAFRTCGLIRGRHPYIVVIDDIQKDNQRRLYEWHMLCPMDVDVVNILGNDVTLSNVPGSFYNQRATTQAVRAAVGKGSPRLLVRALNIDQPQDNPTLQPNPVLETVELKKHDDSHQFTGRSNGLIRRLVLPSRSVTPDYTVVLVPYREGEPQPTTDWNEDHTIATLDWPDQHDHLKFATGSDGRTTLTVLRNDQVIVQSP